MKSAEERLWNRVDVRGPDDCWNWIGKHNGDGRGRLWYQGRREYAYRLVWTWKNGPIPDGMIVCHKCDNPACVNPAHLFLGKDADNIRDMFSKGRQADRSNQFGENCPRHKLTAEQVKLIRTEYGAGKATQVELARRYGVRQTTISEIIRGNRWINT